MFDKKGEMTSTQIVGTVLIVAGLVIILFFIGILAGDTFSSDDELCSVSVLTRATVPQYAAEFVPLKCTTRKLCLSESGSGDSCTQFSGEKSKVIEIEGRTVDDKARFITKTLAENMYQCWSTMGKGQLDIFGDFSDLLGSEGKSSCVICSRVAIGDVNPEILKRVNLDGYLESERIPVQGSDLTYLQAFTDRGTRTFGSIDKDLASKLQNSSDNLQGAGSGQIAFVFSQVKTRSWQDVLKGLGYAAVGSTFVVPGAAKVASALVFNPAGLASVAVVGGAGTLAVGLNAYSGEMAAAGFCGNFTSVSKDGLRGGCSLIQAVNYNVPDINKLCYSLQGNP